MSEAGPRRMALLMAMLGVAVAPAVRADPAGGTSRGAFVQPGAPAGIRAVDAAALRSLIEAERGRVVLLNFWATWCVPCLKEVPDLLTLEREYAPRGLVLIGVAMDEAGDLESRVRPFHARYFPGFRSYVRDAPDMEALARVVDPAWNELLPTSYLIGRDGRVIGRIQGRRSLEQFRTLLDESL